MDNNKVIHILKCHENYLKRLVLGYKNAEVRYNDRDYQLGDLVCFKLNSELQDILDTRENMKKRFKFFMVFILWVIFTYFICAYMVNDINLLAVPWTIRIMHVVFSVIGGMLIIATYFGFFDV